MCLNLQRESKAWVSSGGVCREKPVTRELFRGKYRNTARTQEGGEKPLPSSYIICYPIRRWGIVRTPGN